MSNGSNGLPAVQVKALFALLALVETAGRITEANNHGDASAMAQISSVVASMTELATQMKKDYGKSIDARFSTGLDELFVRLTPKTAEIIREQGVKDFLQLVLNQEEEVRLWPGMNQGRLQELTSIMGRCFSVWLGMTYGEIACW